MKKRLLQSFQPLASKLSLDWLIKISGQRLFLPFYHSVQKDKELPHIRHLYPLRTLDQFEQDLDFFLKHYEPLSLQELFDHLKSEQPFEKNKFFLSFDDGLREIYDWIAPLLLKKGIPATFFLNSAFVDNKDLFFRYKASLILEHLNASEKEIPAAQSVLQTTDFKKSILAVNYQNQSKLDEVASNIGLDFNAFLKTEKPYLDQDQIQNLIEQGFSIGSHSIDHPLYHDISLEEQIRQTSESQAFINQTFPQAVKTFAFPFTDHKVGADFFDTIHEKKIIDLSFGTAGLKKDSVLFHLQRTPMEVFHAQAQEQVHSEYAYFFLKGLMKRNRIDRG